MQIDPDRSYDLIGDVHGCADALAHLLDKLGYHYQGGIWRHPRRQVIFLGDIIDRGAHIRGALHMVRDMVDAGQAYCILGNHEWSALGWYMPAPPGSGKLFVREHSPRFTRLLQETLLQFEHHAEEWKAFRQWFYELPLYLDGERFRVVHACWDSGVIARLAPRLNRGCLEPDLLRESAVDDSFAGQALNRLLRGIDMPLPEGITQTSAEGFVRSTFRSRFWEENPRVYGDVVFQPDGLPEAIARLPLSERDRQRLFLYRPDDPLLFVGHYWCTGRPSPVAPNVACLDYSAVRGGKLVAYRLDHEHQLDPARFVWVNVERKEI